MIEFAVPLVTPSLTVALLWLIWKVWPKIFKRRPQRHYPFQFDGTHETCKCGYSSPWDWNLEKHFAEVGRVGS